MTSLENKNFNQHMEVEDALKVAYFFQTADGFWCVNDIARALDISESYAKRLVKNLISSGWSEMDKHDSLRLTELGEVRALELIRAHRLWERYLVEREGMSLDAVHNIAHLREHEMTPKELEELDAELGYPAWDPHGHAIPALGSHVLSQMGQPLLEVGMPGAKLRIVRLGDEPEKQLTQLVALGLMTGIEIEVTSMESDLLRLKLDKKVISLSFDAASRIFVVPATARTVPMGTLRVGSRAQVVELTGNGKLQRRMLSMGFVPGAEVMVIREAPLGDPLQYRVKKANIALRRDEANTLLVKELDLG